MADRCFLILGGGGMIGLQVARRIVHDLKPDRVVVASLYEDEARAAVEEHRRMFGDTPTEFVAVWGNIFIRDELAATPRRQLLTSRSRRDALFDDLLQDADGAYERSWLSHVIREHRPDVVVDSINTATAISYQDVYTASILAKRRVDSLLELVAEHDLDGAAEVVATAERAFETLLLSMPVPQLVRHVVILHRAMVEVGTRLYVKIGTTGTGGMGLNIPYTHGEDRPSARLLSKTAVAFGHTGLLFLMARTVGGPIVKEIKPAAMVGYAGVSSQIITEHGEPVHVFASRWEPLLTALTLHRPEAEFEDLGPLELPCVDTGENGLFTAGEFEAITSLRQMEFLTPEEIALEVVLEIKGSNTGKDVIAAIDGAVMGPSYRAGYLRHQVLTELERLQRLTGTHSVALGQLGPPELSKLLWEAELLQIAFGKLVEVLTHTPAEIAAIVYQHLQADSHLRHTITSIGVPILTPNGRDLIRGPYIRIPEVAGDPEVAVDSSKIDRWAAKGWVDLRPENFARWRDRFERMETARRLIRGQGSAAVTRAAYLLDTIRPGSIVGWIFNNEGMGYRIK